jgi:hypothetical protein
MNKTQIQLSLCACVLLSAVGGFGSVFCGNQQCVEAWRTSATGALSAAGTLATYLANPPGEGDD